MKGIVLNPVGFYLLCYTPLLGRVPVKYINPFGNDSAFRIIENI